MTPDKAREKLRKLAADRARVEAAEGPAIAQALEVGVRVTDIAADLGRSREHVRRLARANGVESSRPITRPEEG